MKCDKCQEEATVFFTEIVDNAVKKQAFCHACAQEYQKNNPSLPPLDKLFDAGLTEKIEEHFDEMEEEDYDESIFKYEEDESPQIDSDSSNSRCKECDFTFADYQRVGRLGCPTCYSAFEKIIKLKLNSMHEGETHTGRVNKNMVQRINHAKILEELTQKLEQAVQAEDYETAGKLRDEIKEASKRAAEATPPSATNESDIDTLF